MINVMDFGAAANGTTDDSAAFQSAIDSLPVSGGALYIPRGYYRIAQRLVVGKNVHIFGDNAGIRNYRYGDPTNVPLWEAYTGSVLVFDTNVAGFFFPAHTDVEDTNTVVSNRGATGSNATYWKYSGANHSIIERLVLYSKGGTSATAHAIEARHTIHARDMIIFQFGGHGVFISASADSSTSPATKYGNASNSTLTNIFATQNRSCGFRIEGRDANIIKLDNCFAQLNGSWGFSDSGFLGNTYINCHAATNNTLASGYPGTGASANASVGSFQANDINAPHIYIGCYSEGGNGNYAQLTYACQIFGGILSGSGQDNPGIPFVMRGGVAREAPLTHYNRRPSTIVPADGLGPAGYDTAVKIGDGTKKGVALAFGSADASPGLSDGTYSLELRYYHGTTYKIWSLEQPEYYWSSQIAFSNALTTGSHIAPYFLNGLFLGSPVVAVNRHIGFSTSPTAPGNGVYAANDIIFKPAVANGKIGWVCIAGGVKAGPWTPGEFSLYPSSSPMSRVYREYQGRVYALTTAPATSVGVQHPPTHTSGQVVDAQGYGWTFMNNNTVPTFKEWGAIDA